MNMSLSGTVDLHVHGMPSLVQRMNPWDYIQDMERAGYAACIIQDHSASTAGLAYAISQGPVPLRMKVYGCLVMNAAAGGISVACVEAAHRMGARRISFPTTSSPQQLVYLEKYHLVFGGGALETPEPRVSPLDEEGRLTDACRQVLDYIVSHPELILSTGYMGPEEIDAVVTEALRLGHKRVLIDHPYAIVEAEREQIRRWASLGAYIELTAANFTEIAVSGNLPIGALKQVIQDIPVDQLILSSDFGQVRNGSPVEGMRRFRDAVAAFGYSERDMWKMTSANGQRLLGMEG